MLIRMDENLVNNMLEIIEIASDIKNKSGNSPSCTIPIVLNTIEINPPEHTIESI